MIRKSFGSNITSSGTTTLYTVPAGKKAEYRSAYITNTSGSSGTVTMLINSLNFLVGHTISSKDILHLGGREGDFIILPAGATITGTSTQNMTIKKEQPARRKSFRARHKCDTSPPSKLTARYWSCKKW